MRCAACGWQTAGRATACERCGVPVTKFGPTSPTGPQEPWIASRTRQAWRIFAIGLAAAVAAIVAYVVSTPSSDGQLSRPQLKPGDCIAGLHLRLGGPDLSWPAKVSVVPCDQPHNAEVFFAGNVWPRSAPFLGRNLIAGQADWQCRDSFVGYDGINTTNSAYSYLYSFPNSGDDWASGDRFVVCAAFLYPGTPGGTTMMHSIQGSDE
jgi:Septum formation